MSTVETEQTPQNNLEDNTTTNVLALIAIFLFFLSATYQLSHTDQQLLMNLIMHRPDNVSEVTNMTRDYLSKAGLSIESVDAITAFSNNNLRGQFRSTPEMDQLRANLLDNTLSESQLEKLSYAISGPAAQSLLDLSLENLGLLENKLNWMRDQKDYPADVEVIQKELNEIEVLLRVTDAATGSASLETERFILDKEVKVPTVNTGEAVALNLFMALQKMENLQQKVNQFDFAQDLQNANLVSLVSAAGGVSMMVSILALAVSRQEKAEGNNGSQVQGRQVPNMQQIRK